MQNQPYICYCDMYVSQWKDVVNISDIILIIQKSKTLQLCYQIQVIVKAFV